ncbi:MAG: sirohydrochlorin chelatase [Gemmatimonadaceae bacterium]
MSSILRLLSALVLCAPALRVAAQTPATGLLVVAHGGGPDWNQQVLDLAAAVRFGGPVRVSFLMGPGASERPFQREVAALRSAGVTRIAIVPLFISSHSEHFDQLRYLVGARDSLDATMMHHLHMGGVERPADRTGLTLLAALDSAPEFADALAERAESLAPDRAHRAVLLLGHGPNGAEDYARWMAALRPVAERVRRRAGYQLAAVELVRDDAPPLVRAEAVARVREIVTWLNAVTGAPVAVVPALVATGAVSRVTLKRDLDGLPVVYAGDALLPNLGMARWVERVAAAALAAP